jgi:Uma2 family endonuclease
MNDDRLLTAEVFGEMPDEGHPTELIRGRVVAGYWTRMRQGLICTQILHAIGEYLDVHDLGRAVTGNVGIVIARNPDSVRTADLAFFSYDQIPRSVIPAGYPEVPPEFVVDVRADDESWLSILTKALDFLGFGVKTVCILDADSSSAHLFYTDSDPRILGRDYELTFPECLPGFRIPVRNFFEIA